MRSRTCRAIALSVALAGLMAISAGAAQAENGSYWLVNGGKVFEGLLPGISSSSGPTQLLGKIGGVGIHVSCTFTSLVGAHLFFNGALLGKVQFSGCEIFKLKSGLPELLKACTPPGGLITTTSLRGLIVLSSGNPVVVIEPSIGTTFATISTGEECPFGETITLGGKLGLLDSAFLKDQTTHTFSQHTVTTELYLNGNKENKTTMDGLISISLSEAHTGLKWSGHPA